MMRKLRYAYDRHSKHLERCMSHDTDTRLGCHRDSFAIVGQHVIPPLLAHAGFAPAWRASLQRHLVIDSIASTRDSASGSCTTHEEAEDVTNLSDGRGGVCHPPV